MTTKGFGECPYCRNPQADEWDGSFHHCARCGKNAHNVRDDSRFSEAERKRLTFIRWEVATGRRDKGATTQARANAHRKRGEP